jgi:cytochrome P450
MFASGNAHKQLYELHRKYGDVVRTSPNEVSIMGDTAWDELMGHRKRGEAENGKDPLFFLQKHSVIAADRETHSRMRRTLAHGFSAATIEEQQPIIASYVDLLIQKLHEHADGGKKDLDMTSWYNWTTFDIIGDLAFGESFGCLQNVDYHPWVSMIFQRVRGNIQNVLAKRWGWMAKIVRQFMDTNSQKAVTTHTTLVEEKVKKRAQMETARPDYFHTMTSQTGNRVSQMRHISFRRLQ